MIKLPLTKRENRVLRFVRSYFVERGYPPTYQEIAVKFRYPTRHHAKYFVYNLRKKGWIELEQKQAGNRKIRLL